MVVGDAQHLAVHARQDPGEHVGAQPQQVALAHPLERPAHAFAHRVGGRVGRALQAEGEVGEGIAEQRAARHQPRLVGRPRELEGGRPRHEGAVEIEEGRAAGASRR